MRYHISLALAVLAPITTSTPLATGQSNANVALNPSLSGSSRPMGNPAGAGTYPRATRLSDGTILGAYTLPEGGSNILTLVSASYVNGAVASWTQIGTAARRESNTGEVDNAFPLQLPSGRVLLAYRNHDRNAGGYTFFRITISYSDDRGKSWRYLSDPVAYAGTQDHGVWEPFMRLANDGSVQLYYSQENGQVDQDLLMLSSTDGGLTWGGRTTVAGGGIQSRDGMVAIAPITTAAHGKGTVPLIAVFESVDTVNTQRFSLHSVKSFDDGRTWSDRQLVYTPTGTLTNAGSPQVANVGGTLVASFMTDEDTQARAWPNGAAVKLLTSPDGATWGHKLEVFGPNSFWPALLTLDQSHVLYLNDFRGAVSQIITLS